jgi:hypothetical protein
MRTWVLAVALTIEVGVGCGSGKDDATTREAPKPQPSRADATIEIFVNDASVAKIDRAQVAGWPRLDTLVPVSARRLGTWQKVTVTPRDGKPTDVLHPSEKYPDLVPALYPLGDGAGFGMFDPVALAKHGAPQLQLDATAIRIVVAQGGGRGEHESGEGGGTDPSQLKIAIKTPNGASTFEGAKLLALPRAAPPGETDAKGWPLTALLDAAGVTKFERLLLTDASKANLTLDKADLDPKTSVPYVKLNRSGQLRFRIYKKQGDVWTQTGDLRGLVSIEVIK